MNIRNLYYITAFGLVALSNASAQSAVKEVSEADLLKIGILPGSIPVLDGASGSPDERPIGASERNPFSEREDTKPQIVVQTESEEMKLKKIIGNLEVKGGQISRPGGPRILLGDLILEQGTLLPQLIPDQTEQLAVREISEEKIELAFLESLDYMGQPRVIEILIDMRSRVDHVLQGGDGGSVVSIGRDEMDAEHQLAQMLRTHEADGGGFSTSLPRIQKKSATAKRGASNSLQTLIRNYGAPEKDPSDPNAGQSSNGRMRPAPLPSTTAPPSRNTNIEGSGGSATNEFEGFQMRPIQGGGAQPNSARIERRPPAGGPTDDLPSFTN